MDIRGATSQSPVVATANIGNPMAIITKGESLSFVFDRDGESVTGWVCTIKVLQNVADTPEIDRVIALDSNGQWSGFLTQTETAALTSTGIYRLIGVLTNATDDKEEQQIKRFQLNPAWV